MVRYIAVLGGGAGAHTIAGDLALAGHKVNLFELPKFKDGISGTIEKGGVQLEGSEGCRSGFAKLDVVTTDIREALDGVDTILISVPCYGQKTFAEVAIPHLQDGQVISYLGEGGGSLEFVKAMKDMGRTRNVAIGETNSLPYAARIVGPGMAKARLKRGGTLAAAFPSKDNDKLLKLLNGFWPFIEPAENVFETILLNFNAIDHVPAVLMNAGRIELNPQPMFLWKEGGSPAVSRCIERVDKETIAIKKALGIKDQTPYKDWLVRQGMLSEYKDTYYEAIRNSKLGTVVPFQCGPNALQHRFITEDVPYSLVLMASIGDLVGVDTPMMDALITIASTMLQRDYRSEGRTAEKIGIPNVPIEKLRKWVTDGTYL